MSKDQFDFNAKDRLIDEIIFGKNKFRIPRYQRPYSWGSDQVEEFWNDIQGSSDSFFLGSFVFNLEYLEEEGFIEIIDGQQRFLTITIFMSVIRDLARKLEDEKMANRVQTRCIAFENNRGEQTFRIKCGDSINKFFQSFIQKERDFEIPEKLKKEEKLIVNNYRFFEKSIKDELANIREQAKKIEFLQKLWDKVERLKVIWIEIKNEEEAYIIFETVNARGAELSVADLLKNLIFKNIKTKEDGIDIAKKRWCKIEENINNSEVEISKFIRYYWLSKHSFVGEKGLYKAIKDKIKDFNDFLEDLAEASDWFYLLTKGTAEDWLAKKYGKKIYESLRGVRAMRVTQCYVIFLSILMNIKKINLDVSSYFKSVENFTFNYSSVAKLQANKVEKIYSKYAIELYENIKVSMGKNVDKNVSRTLNLVIDKLRELRPNRAIFEERFNEITYKNSEANRIFIKYILARNEKFCGSGENILDFDVVNIEHILPQKPNAKWKITKDDFRDCVHMLGNLALIHKKINSEIGNRSIKEKVEILEKKTEIKTTKDLAREIKMNKFKWTKEEIFNRQRELAELAYNKYWTF